MTGDRVTSWEARVVFDAVRTIRFVGVALVCVGTSACAHTQSVGDAGPSPSVKAARAEPAASTHAPAPDTEHHTLARVDGSTGNGKVPIATSPTGLLKAHAVEDIQERLKSKGHLSADDASGKLDGPTREALRAFQRDAGLPATGVPDDATVQKLGLRPSEIFRASNGDDGGDQHR